VLARLLRLAPAFFHSSCVSFSVVGYIKVMLGQRGYASHEALRLYTEVTAPELHVTQAALCQIAGHSRLVAQLFTQADAVFYAAGCSSQSRNGAMQYKGEGVGAGRRVRGRKKGRKKGSLFGGRWKEKGRLEESEKRRWSGGSAGVF